MKQIGYEDFRKIYKRSYIYEAIYYVLRICQNWIFYKRIHYRGLENIPENRAILFTPNHQNALMDALIVIGAKFRWQPVFMARGDIFHLKPLITKFLILIKILPVYRIRDGKDSLKNNEEVFDLAADVLKNKSILAVYPEANHFGRRRLRTMSKGFAKIAFKAEKESDFNLDLVIIPVGINYKNYFSFRTTALVNFGKPIEIKDFIGTFKENEPKAYLDLKLKVEEEIRPLMIDIKDEQNYEIYESATEIYCSQMLTNLKLKNKNHPNKFKANKETIRIIEKSTTSNPQIFEQLKPEVSKYSELLKKFQLRHHIVENPLTWSSLIIQTLLLIITFPVFIFGFLNNILFFRMPTLITKKIKDRNFHTSIQFGLGFFTFPIYYGIIFLLVWLFAGQGNLKWIYTLSAPIAGILAFEYWIWSLKLSSQWFFRLKFNSPEIQELVQLKNKIIQEINSIYSQFK